MRWHSLIVSVTVACICVPGTAAVVTNFTSFHAKDCVSAGCAAAMQLVTSGPPGRHACGFARQAASLAPQQSPSIVQGPIAGLLPFSHVGASACTHFGSFPVVHSLLSVHGVKSVVQ